MAKKKKVKGLGNLYNGKTAMKRREWRGFRDTMYDFGRWLKLWGVIIFKLGIPCLPQLIKALFKYRWMATYLTAPAFMDRHTIGMRGTELKIVHEQFFTMSTGSIQIIKDIMKRDKKLNKGLLFGSIKAKKLREKTVVLDEMMPGYIMAGFPTLKGIALQMVPVFLAGEIDQQANLPYIDAIEAFGLPADACPLPVCEVGCAVENDYPDIGKVLISSSMPCDGSTMATQYLDRAFPDLPNYQITLPVRFNEPQVHDYAVKNLKKGIEFIENQFGVKWDWDAYWTVMKRANEETEFMMKKWDVNATDYPQVCGPALALHRMFAWQVANSMNPAVLKADKKVFKLMMKGYEHDKKFDIKPKYRAIVWSCPSHYYSNFSFWAQNCWGIKVLVDMECMLSHHMHAIGDKEQAMADLARAYEKMSMRSHTNGGHYNVLEECWKVCKKFNANIVIMYSHVSCKTMAGLQGLFEEQAREHGIHLIWVEHDLCDRRTVSRKEMRNTVNKYMQTVFQAKPLDESLVDYDDDKTW